MGDYRGRRRGRADSQPPQDGGYYADDGFGGSNYRDGYQESGDGYPEVQPDGYGPGHTADQSSDYASDHASDYAEPRFDFGQRPAAYEQQAYSQPYEQQAYDQQSYEQQAYEQVYEQQPYDQQSYGQTYDQTYGQAQDPAYEQLYAPESTRGSRRGRPAEEPEYVPGYLPGYAPEDLTYEPGYDAPSYDASSYDPPSYDAPSYDAPPYDSQPAVPAQAKPRRGSRRGRPADEGDHGPGPALASGAGYRERDGRFDVDAAYDQGRHEQDGRDEDRRGQDRAGAAVPNHLPVVGAIAVAIIVCAFVTPEAVAAVTIVLQAAAALAIRDILRLPGRRAAIVATLPAVAATVGTFRFSADVAATAVAAGLGAGFVLAAGDTVLRSRRRGVEPGATRVLAGTVAALLFAGLTALLTAAARQSPTAAAIGGAVYGILALLAARDRELTASRAAVLGLPAAGAALAAYAAAILVA